ncbi:hypothetical protein, partial [Streptomyces telluris]
MPGYEGIPDIRSAYEDERRGGGCFRPVSCLSGCLGVNLLLLILAAGCEMISGTGEGSSGRAEIIKTSGLDTCVIRLEPKSYRE